MDPVHAMIERQRAGIDARFGVTDRRAPRSRAWPLVLTHLAMLILGGTLTLMVLS